MKVALHGRRLRLVLAAARRGARGVRRGCGCVHVHRAAPSCERRTCRSPARRPPARPVVAESTAAGSVNYPDAEVEPYVAVDPTNPRHLIGSVQQDRWNDGGANGLTRRRVD